MAGLWDRFMKLLVRANPQDFATWLSEEAIVVEVLNVELQSQTRFADALLKIEINGKPALMHIECQLKEDLLMGQRMHPPPTLLCLL